MTVHTDKVKRAEAAGGLDPNHHEEGRTRIPLTMNIHQGEINGLA